MIDTEPAVHRAIDFLVRAQLADGEFRTVLGSDATLADGEWDSSPFVTSLVAYSLSQAGPTARPLIERALSFLLSEMEPGGVWRYYTSKQFKHVRIPPDLDDTACASYVLVQNGKSVPSNRWIILNNTDDRGLFRTWLIPTERTGDRFRQVLSEGERIAEGKTPPMPGKYRENRRFHSPKDPVPAGEVDAVVNANVVLYLGEGEETGPAIQYLVELVNAGPEKYASPYYTDALTLYYMIGRACLHSAPSLRQVGDQIARNIERRHAENGSLGTPLLTALGACALLTFAPDSAALPPAIESLRDSQNEDGSWDRATFYRGPIEFWGSEALTTALCVEALARYRRRRP